MFNRKNDELYQFHIKEGAAYFNAGKYLEATLAFTLALKIDAQNLAYFYRAQAHERTQNYAAAAKDFEDAERLGCNDINYLTRGLMYIQHLKQTAKALKDAVILFKKDMKSECAEIIEQCLPQIKLGDLDEIEKKDLFDSITTLEERGLLEIAISYLEPCLVKDDHNPLSARFWKRDSIMHGAPSTEKGTLKNIGDYVQEKKLKLAENIMQLAIQTGVEQFQAGDNEMAITTFSLVIEENPKCALAFYHRAEVHHHLNQHEAAIQDFCQAETLGLPIKTYKRSLSYAYLNKISEALEDAMYVAKNGTGENGSAIAALCFSQITLDALKKIPRRELFDFIQWLPGEDQIHYLGIILKRGPLTVLGERFWNPQVFKLTPHIEDELLMEIYNYLDHELDSEIILPDAADLEKMDELIKLPSRVQQLRYHICWQNCHESKQELSHYYSNLPCDSYQFEDHIQYLEDYVYLGIIEAGGFVLMALKDLFRHAKDIVDYPAPVVAFVARGPDTRRRIYLQLSALKPDEKNYQSYLKMRNECWDSERLYRNITDHNYKHEDPIQMLRYTICSHKNYGRYPEAELKRLSDYYSPESDHPFTYQSADRCRYVEDFVYLGIDTAEEFVRRAVKEVLENANNIYHTTFKFQPSNDGLRKKHWIIFEGRSFYSNGCRIATLADEKNQQAYQNIWKLCAQEEQRSRNVTNPDYQTDDPVERLRFQIAVKKNKNENYDAEKTTLSQYYLFPEKHNFDYRFDLFEKYKQDFFLLDISAAETFIHRAIREEISKLDRKIIYYYWGYSPPRVVEVPAPKFLSKNCRIYGLGFNTKNDQTYRQLHNAALADEKKLRNVTNRNFKSNDPIEQLRVTLCIKKNDEKDYTSERDALSAHYEFLPEHGGLNYSKDHGFIYLRDFLYLDIPGAKDFVRLAIEDEIIQAKDSDRWGFFRSFSTETLFDSCIIDNLRINDAHYQIFTKMLQEYIHKTGSYDEKAVLEYHYIGDPEDPDRIVYHINNLGKYLHDWQEMGITGAESFVLRAVKENFAEVNTFLEKCCYYEKLLDLICQGLGDMKDLQLVCTLGLKNRILKSRSITEPARILEEAHSMGVLSPLLKDISRTPILSSKMRGLYVLSIIEQPDVLALTALHFYESGERSKREIAAMLFLDGHENLACRDALENLKTYWNDQLKLSETHENESQKESGHFCLDQDIVVDYYYYSLLQDVAELLNLAYEKNPILFAELFCAEMDHFNEKWRDIFMIRKDFYEKLMQHPDMQRFSHYAKCQKALEATYSSHGLASPIKANARSHLDSLTQSLTDLLNQGQQQRGADEEGDDTERYSFGQL